MRSRLTPRGVVTAVAAAGVLGGPTVLAFLSGGYFAGSRIPAAIVAWLLVLALAVAGPAPLPRSVPGWLALGGLAAITIWSAISLAWAPLGGPAVDGVQRLVLYTGALIVAIGAARTSVVQRAIEPALAAGATVVIGYGLTGRLLPDLVTLDRSTSAGGRLEQPITYWNAEGALAAVGFILCARMAGDPRRTVWVRVAGAAATVPLAAGVYLSYSRGAIAVAVLGLAALVALAPTRAQLRAAVCALGAGVLVSACVAALPGVAALEGGARTRDGAVGLALLVCSRDRRGADRRHARDAGTRSCPARAGSAPSSRWGWRRLSPGSWSAGCPRSPARPTSQRVRTRRGSPP